MKINNETQSILIKFLLEKNKLKCEKIDLIRR